MLISKKCCIFAASYVYYVFACARTESAKRKMADKETNIIIYNSLDGRASVALYATDGSVWLNQNQLAELFATSKQSISYHIVNILKDNELRADSVVKDFLTTASDGKQYQQLKKQICLMTKN